MLGTVHLYVDEAGDTGFKDRSSKTFVIGYVVAQNPQRLASRLKKLMSRLSKRHRLTIQEFKFHNDTQKVRSIVLDLIARSEIRCGFVAANKRTAIQFFKDNRDKFYNYLAVNYPIKNIVYERPAKIVYIIDRQSWSKKRRESFDLYVQNKASWVSVMENKSNPPIVETNHKSSYDCPCLQVADYVAGAVFRAVERGMHEYFDQIKEKFPCNWQDTLGALAHKLMTK